MPMNNHMIKKIGKGVLLLMVILTGLLLTHCGGEEDHMYSQRELPYALDALEPVISKTAMALHYYKHHAGYVAKTNQLLKETGLTMTSPVTLLHEINGKENYKPLFNALAQAWNHAFYWECLKPGGGNIPEGKLLDKINLSFGNVAAFKQQFVSAAASQFGSGWVWLVKENDGLTILTTANADTPVAHGIKPILVVDVWEHAYYLDYKNRRKEFVQSVLDNLVNWAFVQEQLTSAEEPPLKKKNEQKSITSLYQIDRFIDVETCGGCHSDIYIQWENSLHHLSHKDSIYKSVSDYLRKDLTCPDEIKEAEACVKCHTPVGFITGYPTKSSDDIRKIPELAQMGIQCDYCHSATTAHKTYNNGLQIEPGNGEDDPGIKRGPFKDSESDYHEVAYSEFHTNSEICGTCHDVKHVVFGTDLETTYTEWKNGPYNSNDLNKRVTCQGCHMYQRPDIPATGSTERPKNPGVASDDGPDREHIFTHYFVGANAYLPKLNGDMEKAQMAISRLQHSAALYIDKKQLAQDKLVIEVKNIGAGHYLPTGLTDVRQMWLEIVVKNKYGEIVFASGLKDKNQYLPEDTIIYNTIFGDGKGNPVHNIAKAREILKDRRIPPKKSLIETIELPSKNLKGGQIKVSLFYRSASQKLIDTIKDKEKHQLPIIKMAEVKVEI